MYGTSCKFHFKGFLKIKEIKILPDEMADISNEH